MIHLKRHCGDTSEKKMHFIRVLIRTVLGDRVFILFLLRREARHIIISYIIVPRCHYDTAQ